jgi:hypothetical protein
MYKYEYNKETNKIEKIVDKPYLLKKMDETEKYFLIPELKSKVEEYHYNKLENKYLERKEKIKN